MKNIKSMKKILILTMIFLSVGGFVFAGPQNGTGMDTNLAYLGIKKPIEWNSWSEREKHAWLRENGIFPQNGRKYQGYFDEDKFWEFVGVERPESWEEMSFEEKNNFIKNPIAIGEKLNDKEVQQAIEVSAWEQGMSEGEVEKGLQESVGKSFDEENLVNINQQHEEDEHALSGYVWGGLLSVLLVFGLFWIKRKNENTKI